MNTGLSNTDRAPTRLNLFVESKQVVNRVGSQAASPRKANASGKLERDKDPNLHMHTPINTCVHKCVCVCVCQTPVSG